MFTENIIQWLQQFSQPWLDQLFLGITYLGSEYVYLALFTFVYWCINRRAGRTLLLTFLVSAWLNSVLKDALGLPRPSGDLVRVMAQEWSAGFPSGHAQNAAVVWGYIAMRWPKRWVTTASAAIICLISLSRLYLGVHYLGQVLAGLGLGLACAIIGSILERKNRLAAEPKSWRAVLTVICAYLVAIPVQSDDGFRVAGILLGFLLTDALPRRTDDNMLQTPMLPLMQHSLSWPVRLGRAAVGWAGLAVGYFAVKLLVAPGLSAMLACTAVAVWITTGAPVLFRFLRLGKWENQLEEHHADHYPIPIAVPTPDMITLSPATAPVFTAGLCLLLAVGMTLSGMRFTGKFLGSVPVSTEAVAMPSALPALQMDDSFVVLAHKGGEGLAPGNTLAAFGMGLQVGADILECDVRRTRDGELVVIHDEKVDKVTNGVGLVSEMTLQQLRELDAGYYFTYDNSTYPFRNKSVRIATLDTVLRAYPTARFNIDMKDHSPDMPHTLLAVLDAANARDRVIVASFDGPTIRRFRLLAPDIPTALASDEMLRFVVMSRLGLGAYYQPPARYMQVPERQGVVQIATPATFRLAHRLGMDVHIWTVNSRADMRRLISTGADGIVTDYPDRLVETLTN